MGRVLGMLDGIKGSFGKLASTMDQTISLLLGKCILLFLL